MADNNIFDCDREPVPCSEPQVSYYPESVPGGEQSMGSCVPCPAEFPWLDVYIIGDEIQLKQLTLHLFAQSTYFGIDFDLILNP